MFLEFRYESLTFKDNKWEELADKWKLDIITDRDTETCTAYTDDYLVWITGESLDIILNRYRNEGEKIEKRNVDEPTNYVVLTINSKIEMKIMLTFLRDFLNIIDNTEDMGIFILYEIGETPHPKWLIDMSNRNDQ